MSPNVMRLHTPELLWKWNRALHRRGCKRLARVVKTLNSVFHKCLLPAEAEVGCCVILEHFALSTVMHPQVRIGHGCRIYPHVTLAGETWIGSPRVITLEDEVTIGRRSILGAGSVLTKDMPAHKIWAGNPARKIGVVPPFV